MVTAGGSSQRVWTLADAPSVVAFYRANVAEVHRYLSRLTGGDRARTEDLVQEVFIALAAAVRDGRLQVAHIGWLMATARRAFLHDDRHGRRERERVGRVAAWRTVASTDTARVVDQIVLRDAVGRLSDEQRAALVFRYVDDLPVAKVASLLGRSVEATESLLVRARRRFGELMEETEDGR